MEPMRKFPARCINPAFINPAQGALTLYTRVHHHHPVRKHTESATEIEMVKNAEVLLLVLLLTLKWCHSGEIKPRLFTTRVGEKLLLTPLLGRKEIQSARNLSQVLGFHPMISSYAGYFTVKQEYDSNLFFWFFPAMQYPENAPLILWLSGGPGSSSIFAVFLQSGPFYVDDDGTLGLRHHTWIANYSVLYVDQPVGTGFSFTRNENGYARSQADVTRDLYEALIQFFTLFPEQQRNDFYVSGDSYGGKYVPNIADKIFRENEKSTIKIKLKGLIVGNGLTDPVSTLRYGDFFYYLGLLDEKTRDYFKQQEQVAENLINRKEYAKALMVIDSLVSGDLTPYPTLFHNATGLSQSIVNYMRDSNPDHWKYFLDFVNSPSSRLTLHVGSSRLLSWNRRVFQEMQNDIMMSAKPVLEQVLQRKTRVLYLHGMMDLLVPYSGAQNFYKSLKWDGSADYLRSQRKIWRVDDGRVAGFVREARNFVEVAVRNAGHLVLCDQPIRALDIVTRFINGNHIVENEK